MTTETSDADHKVRRAACSITFLTTQPSGGLTELWTRYPRWNRLLRAVAWLWQFVTWKVLLRTQGRRGQNPIMGPLTAAEIGDAELGIIRGVQRES